MLENMTDKRDGEEITKKNKVVSQFQYIGELNKLKQKVILKARDYRLYNPIASFPDDPEHIKIYY